MCARSWPFLLGFASTAVATATQHGGLKLKGGAKSASLQMKMVMAGAFRSSCRACKHSPAHTFQFECLHPAPVALVLSDTPCSSKTMCAVMGLAANKCELHGCLPCARRGRALLDFEVLLPACGHAACVSRAQCSDGGRAARNVSFLWRLRGFLWPGACAGSVGHSAVRLWADIPRVLGRGTACG
jgi:hypothetical protein